TFSFLSPQRLLQVDAYNGGTGSSTVSLACAGQTTRSQSVVAGSRVTIAPGWLGTCSSIAVSSSNGWWTNFDNVVFDAGSGQVIAAVQSLNVSRGGAPIPWPTNVGATSQVDYGQSTNYGASTPLDSTLLTSHTVQLSGLASATQYHFRVRSADSAGNLSVSG